MSKRKGFLFQDLPPRGTGLKRGTARSGRGRGRSLSDAERRMRHRSIYGQFKGPFDGVIINRIKDILQIS